MFNFNCHAFYVKNAEQYELKPKDKVDLIGSFRHNLLARFKLSPDPSNWNAMKKAGPGDLIEYSQADACEPFEQLAEGSVDVIISVYCLHWVSDKRKVMENVFRFLRPGGRFYLIISAWSDLFPKQHMILRHNKWRAMLLEGLARAEASSRPQLRQNDVEAGLDRDTGRPVAAGAKRKFSNLQVVKPPDEEQICQFWHKVCLAEKLDLGEVRITFDYYPVKTVKYFLGSWLNYVPEDLHQEFQADYFKLIEEDYVAEDELFGFYYNYATIVSTKP